MSCTRFTTILIYQLCCKEISLRKSGNIPSESQKICNSNFRRVEDFKSRRTRNRKRKKKRRRRRRRRREKRVESYTVKNVQPLPPKNVREKNSLSDMRKTYLTL